MSDLVRWLDVRNPEAPADLRQSIEEAVASSGSAPTVEVLARAGKERLEAAVARPGRVRESAFDLLVADALVTYACEAALEADHPEEVLRDLAEVGRTR